MMVWPGTARSPTWSDPRRMLHPLPRGGRKLRFRSGPIGTIGRCGLSSTLSSGGSFASSSSEISVNETSTRRISRSSSSAISSGCCSGRRARRGCGRSTASSSRRRVGRSHVVAGSPSSSLRRLSSVGIASSCGGSGPTARAVARAGHRSMPQSERSSSDWPGRTRAGAASGSTASSASLGCE
jgi:hypothetical protein